MPKKKVDEKKGWIRIFPEFNPVRVKYKDIFDMKQFYEDLHEWTLEYGWKDYEEDLDRYETYYGERIAQGGAKELWLIWRLQKTPAGVPTIAGKTPPSVMPFLGISVINCQLIAPCPFATISQIIITNAEITNIIQSLKIPKPICS